MSVKDFISILCLCSFQVCDSAKCELFDISEIKRYCAELEVEHGTVCYTFCSDSHTHKYWWVATITCQDGFHLVNNVPRQCYFPSSKWIWNKSTVQSDCVPDKISNVHLTSVFTANFERLTDAYKMIGWYLPLVFITSSIQGCWSQECYAYEDSDVRFVCLKLEFDNGDVCYKRKDKFDGFFLVTYWDVMFICNKGYYLYGPTKMQCRLWRYYYWYLIGGKPVCFPEYDIASSSRARTERTTPYYTTPTTTRPIGTTAAATKIPSLTTTNSRASLSSILVKPKHVPLITNKSEVDSSMIKTSIHHHGATEYADNTEDNAGPEMMTPVVSENTVDEHLVTYISVAVAITVVLVICVGIVIICCRKRKHNEGPLTISDHQSGWAANLTYKAKAIAKDQMVVVPVCDIKTTTVLHDTRIYPEENKWLASRDSETPVPHNTLATFVEEEEEEGILTNVGYEDEDYVHGIFQRLNDSRMGENPMYAKLPDSGVRYEVSTDSDYNTLNSNAIHQHRSDYSHISLQHNDVDDDTYSHLHRKGRRCSGEATYSHLYDSWLDRHQHKGHSTNMYSDLPTDSNSTTDDKEMAEEPGSD